MIKKVSLILIFALSAASICAQKKISFKIILPTNINAEKVKIMYDDGVDFNFIPVIFKNNETTLIKEIKDGYAAVSVIYPVRKNFNTGIGFLINEKSQFIRFNNVSDSTLNPFSSHKEKNVIIERECKEYLALKKFSKNENDSNIFYGNQYGLYNTDSSLKKYNKSILNLALKELEFIKLHGNKYFYLKYFRRYIVNVLIENYPLEVYETFNTAFQRKFKESYEGINLKALIVGNLFLKKGYKSPIFDLVDIKGDSISLSRTKGKFVLLTFWATWCGPCLAEIPMLKKIRSHYSKDMLTMISVSCDADSTAFVKGLKKYDMDWTHIFGNNTMSNLFGNKPIPSNYLIGPDGLIKFSSWEDNLETLDKILTESIKQK